LRRHARTCPERSARLAGRSRLPDAGPPRPASEVVGGPELELEVLDPFVRGEFAFVLPPDPRRELELPEHVAGIGEDREASRCEPLDSRTYLTGESRAEVEPGIGEDPHL